MQASAGGQRTLKPAAIDSSQRAAITRINSWKRFRKNLRHSGRPLLNRLPRYPDSVLVAGCQRSGTTMLTRLIAGADPFSRLSLTHDDELDAALALIGEVDLPIGDRRYCFQTTYLNASYTEYHRLGPDQRLIWLLRDPQSVVFSMVYNWRRWGLNELYEDCGIEKAVNERQRRLHWPWPAGPSAMEKACLAYAAKTAQIQAIRKLVSAQQLLVVDYDQIVTRPSETLPRIFEFAGAEYQSSYAARVRTVNLSERQALPRSALQLLQRFALPVYQDCSRLVMQ